MPNADIQRGHVALMFVRAFDWDTSNRPDPTFNDVNKNTDLYAVIATVVDEGLFVGDDKGNFNPTDSMTRGEMATVLVRAFDLEGKGNMPFSDVPQEYWAYDEIKTLVANNMTLGYDDGTFKPKKPIIRAEFSEFMFRGLMMNENKTEDEGTTETEKPKESEDPIKSKEPEEPTETEEPEAEDPIESEEPADPNTGQEGQSIYDFSIYDIRMYDNKSEIESKLGKPKRITYDNKGLKIHTYYKNDYADFFIVVGYDVNDQVAWIYTNHDDLFTVKKNGKSLELYQHIIAATFDDPSFTSSTEWDQFRIGDNSVATFYYELHSEALPVRALLISRYDSEGYTIPSNLFESDNFLVFDITNSYRKKFDSQPLTWDERAANTAFKHSKDMALNRYFDHYSQNGDSPFDRMEKEGITFSGAGENIAAGYQSGIHATEGWMNSTTGHRENMLNSFFTHLGVGTFFGDQHAPHYTQNFFTPWH